MHTRGPKHPKPLLIFHGKYTYQIFWSGNPQEIQYVSNLRENQLVKAMLRFPLPKLEVFGQRRGNLHLKLVQDHPRLGDS